METGASCYSAYSLVETDASLPLHSAHSLVFARRLNPRLHWNEMSRGTPRWPEPQAEGVPRTRLRQRQQSQMGLARDLGQNGHRIKGKTQYRVLRYTRSFCLRVQAYHDRTCEFFAVSSTAPSVVRQLDLLIGVTCFVLEQCFPRLVEDSYLLPENHKIPLRGPGI